MRETRDVLVEASVKNPDQKLLPGMFADVHLTAGSETLPSVPKAAVFDANRARDCQGARAAKSAGWLGRDNT